MKRSASRENSRKKRGLRGEKNRRLRLLAVIAVLLLLGMSGLVAARYISAYQKEAEVHASGFHFSSNYLGADKKESWTVSDWGAHQIDILLYNYEKENTALISETAIQYTISVDSDWNVSVSDADGTLVQPENGVYTMPQNSAAAVWTLTLTYTGTGEPNGVNVTVKSVSPYEKTLAAEFVLSAKSTPTYTVTDKGDYEVVTIQANDYHGLVKVTWNAANHSPDNTNKFMQNWQDAGENSSGRFQIEEFTTYELIFVENKTGEYGNKDIMVEIGE